MPSATNKRKRKIRLDLPRFLHVRVNKRVPKSKATVVLIHGIGNTGGAWDKVVERLPEDLSVVTVDLLGFGKSPKPSVSYNNRIQARSIILTLLRLRMSGQVILVGHSMGSLISIELAKRYPFLIRGMVLCSPPIYRDRKQQMTTLLAAERVLVRFYRGVKNKMEQKPDRFFKIAKQATKAKLASESFQLDETTVEPYLAALEYSIIEQTSMKDIQNLDIPIRIIYGRLDPVVVTTNLKVLAQNSYNISLHPVTALHEVTSPYIPKIVAAVHSIAEDIKKR